MRDDPIDAPIPEEFKPDTYYDERLAEDMKRLAEVRAMSDAECGWAAIAEHDDAVSRRAKYITDKDAEAARLNAMLAKVQAWNPPTPDHSEMKSFMIQQLEVSMPGDYVPANPVLLDGLTWRMQTIERLTEAAVRHQEEIRKENDRAAGRTEWLRQLRQSLAA
jgi:hypothetical protein